MIGLMNGELLPPVVARPDVSNPNTTHGGSAGWGKRACAMAGRLKWPWLRPTSGDDDLDARFLQHLNLVWGYPGVGDDDVHVTQLREPHC